MAQKVEVQFVGGNASLLNAAKGAESALATFQKAAKTLMAGFGVAFGVTEVMRFGKESVKAFGEEEAAAVTLQTVLMATGRGGAESFEKIRVAIEKVSGETGILDDDLLRATGTLAQYAKKLSVGDLAKAQTAIVALSTLTGKSLDESASMLGRSLSGTRNLLTRYIGDMDKGASQSEKLRIANERLAASYEVAKEKVNTAEGAMRVMHNGFVRLQEAVGGIILKSFGFQGAMRDIGVALMNLANWLRQNGGEWGAWAHFIGVYIGSVVGQLVDVFAIASSLGSVLGKGGLKPSNVQEAWREIKAAVQDIKKLNADADKAFAATKNPKPVDWLAWNPNLKVQERTGGEGGGEKPDKKALENLAEAVKLGLATQAEIERLRQLELQLFRQAEQTNLPLATRVKAYQDAVRAAEALSAAAQRDIGAGSATANALAARLQGAAQPTGTIRAAMPTLDQLKKEFGEPLTEWQQFIRARAVDAGVWSGQRPQRRLAEGVLLASEG